MVFPFFSVISRVAEIPTLIKFGRNEFNSQRHTSHIIITLLIFVAA
jgi:hypothetical protein